MKHLDELEERLVHDHGFFATVINSLTISVSDMFRDPSFYLAFRERVLPLIRTYPWIHIWHAGCATGEEVYSTAILLFEEGLYDRVQIYATDLNVSVLEQAQSGVYPAKWVRQFTSNYYQSGGKKSFADYYRSAYERIVMKEHLKKNIFFFQHDLVCDKVFCEPQVIFCRNVLIYFDNDLRRNVLQKFKQSLCRGGFLCLGSSENLPKNLSTLTGFRDFFVKEHVYRSHE